MTFDPSSASGESSLRGARAIELNEVLLNGDDREGGFFRKRILLGRTDRNTKPEEIELTKPADGQERGAPLTVVFLKIRRKLVERGRKGEILRSTTEHNTKDDTVRLYEGGERKEPIVGKASALRERFQGLRTVQVVYALLIAGPNDAEVVRITIKGSSLGSEVKEKSIMSFYDYLSSFNGEDHFYEYKTILTPVKEHGAKDYYTIDFSRGEKLTPKGYEIALAEMERVHNNCVEVDAGRASKIAAVKDNSDFDLEQEDAPAVAGPGIDYPQDEINPDDIPF